MANAYTHKYGATRHKELLEDFTTQNQRIAELADSLRPHARTNIPALNILTDIIKLSAENERGGFELLTIILKTK